MARVAREANFIVSDPQAAARWAEAGNLQPGDLEIRHPSSNNNRFRPASAFNGANKCNVFALDIAWRSGFCVPLLNIGSSQQPRYSFPRANTLTTYAERAYNRGQAELLGSSGRQWGWVDTNIPAVDINHALNQPGYMCILVGWRRSGTGHVGIIRQIVSKTNDRGRISDIAFEGWEATGTGAREFVNQPPQNPPRRWRTTACGRLTGACSGNPAGNPLEVFCAIHIIGLIPEADPDRRGVLMGSIDRCRLT
jgi:hypothetical protein